MNMDDGANGANGADAILVSKVDALMRAYERQFRDSQWRAVSVEQQFSVPIINPDTGRPSRTFCLAGRVDGILEGDWLLEHKTTSDDISDPHCDYWRRLAVDHQVSAYMLAYWQQGRKLAGTLYNVLRKPTIRPKRLEKGAIAKIASLREYCGQRVPDDVVTAVVAGQGEECPVLFGLRLYADAIERPGHYFQQQAVARLDRDLLEWGRELWAVAQEIRTSKPFRNTNACLAYGKACEYLGICSGYDEPSSQNWRESSQVHEELELGGDGRDVLTYSRIQCYLTCREKHRFRHVLGLRRVKEEDQEALRFGTLWHEAQAEWWQQHNNRKDDDNGEDDRASAGSQQQPNQRLGPSSHD